MNWKPHTQQPTGNETFAALFAIRADDGDLVLLDGLRQWLPESGRWIVESTDEDVTEAVFWWLAESEVLAPLEAVTKTAPDNLDRKSTRLNSSHNSESRMPSSA
jgi:hypothetical protein